MLVWNILFSYVQPQFSFWGRWSKLHGHVFFLVHVSGGPCGLSGIVYVIQVVATQRFFMFTPKLGEDEPILTCAYFFKWVGEPTTNQYWNHRDDHSWPSWLTSNPRRRGGWIPLETVRPRDRWTFRICWFLKGIILWSNPESLNTISDHILIILCFVDWKLAKSGLNGSFQKIMSLKMNCFPSCQQERSWLKR